MFQRYGSAKLANVSRFHKFFILRIFLLHLYDIIVSKPTVMKFSAALRALLLPTFMGLLLHSCAAGLEEKVNDLETRVSKLESQVYLVNEDLASLRTLVQQISEGKRVIKWDATDTGYILTFSDNSTLELKHGSNGQDGATPAIGVKKDDGDGNWYWTLNGQWLRDANNERVRANGIDGQDGAPGTPGTPGTPGSNGTNGTDGITPQVKIDAGYWWLSTDNGAHWTQLAPYQEPTATLIKSIDTTSSSQYIIITLSDNSTLNIPKKSDLAISFEQTEIVAFVPGETRDISFTLSGGTAKNTVKALGQGGWIASVSMTSATQGKVSVTAPDPLVSVEVVVLVSDGEGYLIIASLDLVKGIVSFDTSSANAPVGGGQVNLTVSANADYDDPVIDADWVSLNPTAKAVTRKDVLSFTVKANNGFERACTVKLYKDGHLMSTAAITQDGGFSYDGFGIVNGDQVIYGHSKAGGQMGVYSQEGKNWCRFLQPASNSYYEIGPVPDGVQAGDSFAGKVSLITNGQTVQESERTFKVYSYEGGVLSMQDTTGEAYIVRL